MGTEKDCPKKGRPISLEILGNRLFLDYAGQVFGATASIKRNLYLLYRPAEVPGGNLA